MKTTVNKQTQNGGGGWGGRLYRSLRTASKKKSKMSRRPRGSYVHVNTNTVFLYILAAPQSVWILAARPARVVPKTR